MNAREFAIKAHGKQMYGEKPYIAHLDAVAEILKRYGDNAITIGYLHDVLEDTETTKEDIAQEFGIFIAECVALITDEHGENRKERKAKTYKKLATIGAEYSIALVVKTADRLANVSSCYAEKNWSLLKMYQKESVEFKLAVYRLGLCDELWQKLQAYC